MKNKSESQGCTVNNSSELNYNKDIFYKGKFDVSKPVCHMAGSGAL